MSNHSQTNEAVDAPDVGLDMEQTQRVMMHLAKSMGEFTREELFAKVDVIDTWYREMIADRAMWNLWASGQVEFNVDEDGEIVIQRTP